jgi:hypothetical protein
VAGAFDVENQELRNLVGVQRVEAGFESGELVGGGFEDEEGFGGRFDFALLAVDGFDGGD